MSHSIDPLQTKPLETHLYPVEPEEAEGMEEVYPSEEKKVENNPYLSSIAPPSNDSLRPLSEIRDEAYGIIKELKGWQPVSSRLAEIYRKISKTTEAHLLRAHENNAKREEEILENVGKQQGLKNWGGAFHLLGAFGGGFLSLAAAVVGGDLGKTLTTLASFLGPLAQAGNQVTDGKAIPYSHDQSLFLNQLQSIERKVEGMKDLPKEVRNFVLELIRLEREYCQQVARMNQ